MKSVFWSCSGDSAASQTKTPIRPRKQAPPGQRIEIWTIKHNARQQGRYVVDSPWRTRRPFGEEQALVAERHVGHNRPESSTHGKCTATTLIGMSFVEHKER